MVDHKLYTVWKEGHRVFKFRTRDHVKVKHSLQEATMAAEAWRGADKRHPPKKEETGEPT